MTSLQAIQIFASLALAGLIGLYLYTFYKFHQIVLAERPEWVDRKGSLSFFFQGFPRVSDPNVTVAVLRTVLSSRVRELRSPQAATYARRLRQLLLVIPLMFAFIIVAGSASAPNNSFKPKPLRGSA
jgi:hypothetical protein